MAKLGSDGRVSSPDSEKAIVAGLQQLADAALNDGILTEDEERRFLDISGGLEIGQDRLQELGLAHRLTKAAVLRDLENGIFKSRVSLSDGVPIILGRSEEIIWAFSGTTLLEYKTRSRTVGRSHGVSIRIARGVYYRVGAFQGHRISESTLEPTDQGMCLLSSKNWFFWGPRRQAKMPLRSILSVQGYSDGIEVTPSSAAKPKVFKLPDPEFAANLVSRAASLAR